MDIYKLKWKMKFRLKKVKSLCKLVRYQFILKFNLQNGDDFYYRMHRNLERDMLRADPEEEYLAEHGLLPEPEPEPEEPPEPGLIREVFLLLSTVHHEGITYVVMEMKEYEDHMFLNVSRATDEEAEGYSFDLPHKAGERYTDFVVEGQPLRFDGETLQLLIPED